MASDCDDLRAKVVAANQARNEALKVNATAVNAGAQTPHPAEDLRALRLALDAAALEARQAGCNVDDLVRDVPAHEAGPRSASRASVSETAGGASPAPSSSTS